MYIIYDNVTLLEIGYRCNITYLPLIGLLPTFVDEVAASAPDSDKNAQSLSDKIASQPVDDCCSDEFYKVSNILFNASCSF